MEHPDYPCPIHQGGHTAGKCALLRKLLSSRNNTYESSTVSSVGSGNLSNNVVSYFYFSKSPFLFDSIILDTGATHSAVSNPAFLSGLVELEDETSIRSMDGHLSKVLRQGNFLDFGRAYFMPDCKVNILSLDAVRCLYNVTYNDISNTFTLTSKSSPAIKHVFNCQNGLYLLNVQPNMTSASDYCMLSTRLNKKEREIARKARDLHIAMGHPSDSTLINSINNSTIMNVPFTRADLENANELFGHCTQCQQAKCHDTTPRESLFRTPSLIGDLIHIDTFFISESELSPNKTGSNATLEFLITVDHRSDYVYIVPLSSRTEAAYLGALTKVIQHYSINNHTIKKIQSDNERGVIAAASTLTTRFPNIEFHFVPAGDHCHRAERFILTVKEHFRASLFGLKYNLIPTHKILLVKYIGFTLNHLTNANNNTQSPGFQFNGKKLNYDFISKAKFGYPVICPVADKNLLKDCDPRGEIGIVLGVDTTSDNCILFLSYNSKSEYPVLKSKFEPCNAINLFIGKYKSNRFYIPTDPNSPIIESGGDTNNNQLNDYYTSNNSNNSIIRDEFTSNNSNSSSNDRTTDQSTSSTNSTTNSNNNNSNIIISTSASNNNSSTSTTTPIISLPKNILSNNIPFSTVATTSNTSISLSDVTTSSNTPTNSILPTRVSSRTNKGQNAKHGCFSLINHMTITQARAIDPVLANEGLKDEISNMFTQNVFFPLPPDTSLFGSIPSHLFAKKKLNSDGSLKSIKMRLVAGGDRQVDSFSYTDTFAPTIETPTIHLLLSLVPHYRLKTSVVDIKCAFLNAELEKPINMILDKSIAQSFIEFNPSWSNYLRPNGAILVQLKKALYGTREAARCWNQNITITMIEKLHFKQSTYDKCLFYYIKDNIRCYIGIHVDDLLICCNNDRFYDDIILTLSNIYDSPKVQSGGDLIYLGCELRIDPNDYSVTLSQADYIKKILVEYNINSDTPCPVYTDIMNHANDSVPFKDIRGYMSLVMKLLYISNHTRPDISFPVSYLTTKNTCPSYRDWQSALRLLSYLKHTIHLNLVYRGMSEKLMIAYTDASNNLYADAKSQSGYCIYLHENSSPIYSRSIRQKCISRGSTEAEIVAMDECILRTVRIKDLLKELGVDLSILVYGDNKSCIELAQNGITRNNSNAKFFIAKTNLLRDNINNYKIDVQYISTDEMIVDFLTKPTFGKSYIVQAKRLLKC